MPGPVSHNTITNTLRKFRLEIANAIFRNAVNPQLVKMDMQSHHHIGELCDDYSLRSLTNWIGTKCGFIAYADAIESASQVPGCQFECLPGLSSQYPFVTNQEIISPEIGLSIAERVFPDILQPSPSLLGALYELISACPLSINADGIVDIKKAQTRRSVGQFYTPPWVVEYCLNQSIDQSSIFPSSNNPPIADTRKLACLRFLDPSCGTGNFLTGFLRWCKDRGLAGSDALKMAGNSLYGIDIDGKAVALARIAIILSLSEDLHQVLDRKGTEIALREISRLVFNLQTNLTVSDSLLLGALLDGSEMVPPPVPPWLADTKFDVVATNPPYISFGSRNQPKRPESWSTFLRLEYPLSAEYKIRLHSIFQEICLKFTKPGGHAALLVPDSFLTGRYYEKLRLKLLEATRIKNITELPDNIIGNATVGRWCVSVYQKIQPEENYLVDLYSLSASSDQSGTGNSTMTHFRLPLDILVTRDRSRFRLLFNAVDRDIVKNLDALDTLGNTLKGHTGLRGKNGQQQLISRKRLGNTWQKGITSGSRVSRHNIGWDQTWLNINPSLLFAGGFNKEIIKNTKLMVRQTGDRLIAGVDTRGLYHLNNVHSFSPVQTDADKLNRDDLVYYFCGLLNSSFFLYLYQLKAREAGRKLAQIDIETVETMPAAAQSELSHAISSLARHVQVLKKNPEWAERGDNHISLLERSIDSLVYVLYPLTTDQIQFIEELVIKKLAYQTKLPAFQTALSIANGVNE